jgi:transposase-like protein
MPLQLLLSGFPDGATRVGSELSILKKEGKVTYFVGAENWFSHRDGERSSCRYALAMFVENGHVRPRDVTAALGIAPRTLMRWCKQFREEGADSFFRPVRHGGPCVMTPQKVRDCEALLAGEPCVAAVARQAGVDESTLRKALTRGAVDRLAARERCAGGTAVAAGTTKSERSRLDA